jgi:hypothetical protein
VNLPETRQNRSVSDREIWPAIRYLDPELQRGFGDILAIMALCWAVLIVCAMYLAFRL